GTVIGYAFAPAGAGTAIYAICTKADGSTRGDSVQVNTIAGPASVTVTSPNGGEVLDHTANMNVTWNTSGIKSASLALYRNDTFYAWIVKDLGMNDGKQLYSWIPNNVMPIIQDSTPTYKIYITGQKVDGTGYVDDKSDAPFRFVSGTSSPQGSLKLGVDVSSPAYAIMPAGSNGVTIGVFKARAIGEN